MAFQKNIPKKMLLIAIFSGYTSFIFAQNTVRNNRETPSLTFIIK